jgi:seryl-tRNA synthetase
MPRKEDLTLHTRLKGTVTLSDNIENLQDEISQLIDTVNEKILPKGIPAKEKVPKVTRWSAKRSRLEVVIEGGRAHVAILRLKNFLAEELGRKHRIGVREVAVKEYTVRLAPKEKIPFEKIGYLRDQLAILPEISDVNVTEQGVALSYKEISLPTIRKGTLDRVIAHCRNIIIKGMEIQTLAMKVTKIKPGTILERSKRKKLTFNEDPTEVGAKLGWIKEFPGKGQHIYTPPLSKLFRIMTNTLVNEVALKLGFQEFLLPKLVNIDIYRKMKYLEGIPEGLFYVCPPKRDPELFEVFKREVRLTHEIPAERLRQGLEEPRYVLDATQCCPFYQFIEGELVRKEDLPIKAFDYSGYTYRWEGGAARGLERIMEFQRIELVWLGTPEQTENIRKQIVDETKKVVEKIFDLEWRITVSDDPFYMKGRIAEEREIKLPDLPTILLEAYLPFRGPRKEDSSWLSLASFNNHGEHFVEAFSVKETKGRTLFTGCTGFGTSRFVAAFLAQYGFDVSNWPQKMREKMLPVPEVPKFLTWPSA